MLGNNYGPDSLPSATARGALLGAVARHEARLTALQQQAEGALRRGEAEAEEALDAAILGLDAGLSDATRALATDLDELTASCEDSIVQSALGGGGGAGEDGGALEDMVAAATPRQPPPKSVWHTPSVMLTCSADELWVGRMAF